MSITGRTPFRTYLPDTFGPQKRIIIAYSEFRPGNPLGAVVRIASDFVWKEHDEGDLYDYNEGITDSDNLIQSILDAAWEKGYRPRGYADVKNETAAIRDHLSDMKAIAFHKLGIKA